MSYRERWEFLLHRVHLKTSPEEERQRSGAIRLDGSEAKVAQAQMRGHMVIQMDLPPPPLQPLSHGRSGGGGGPYSPERSQRAPERAAGQNLPRSSLALVFQSHMQSLASGLDGPGARRAVLARSRDPQRLRRGPLDQDGEASRVHQPHHPRRRLLSKPLLAPQSRVPVDGLDARDRALVAEGLGPAGRRLRQCGHDESIPGQGVRDQLVRGHVQLSRPRSRSGTMPECLGRQDRESYATGRRGHPRGPHRSRRPARRFPRCAEQVRFVPPLLAL